MRTPFILALAAIGLTACNKEAPKGDIPKPALVRTIALGQSQELFLYSGEIRTRIEADLGFRVGGKIVERRVNLGDRVQQGQLLARLDPKDIELNASAIQAQVVSADADVRLARVEFDRANELAARQFVSSSVVDQRRAALQAAEARLRQAQAQSDVAGNQTQYTHLLADRSGVITSVSAESGQVVSAGQAVFRIAEGNEREVLIYVPEKRIASLKPGAVALVRPWAAQDLTVPGVVREVGASADTGTRTYAVRVAVPTADARFSLGGTAAVGFPSAREESIVLPNGAVTRYRNTPTVWLVGPDGTVSPHPVKTGAFREDGVMVLEGLKNGDRVVIVGSHTLVPGLKVNPVEASSPVALDVQR